MFHDIKKPSVSPKRLALVALCTGFVGEFGKLAADWLVAHRQQIPEYVVHLVVSILPSQKALLTLSHDLYWICTPMLVIPFSYVFIREWIYVDRIYVLRDLVEAKKLKPTDLTPEQFRFIYDHWPELFK
jgi:hypothetical protein